MYNYGIVAIGYKNLIGMQRLLASLNDSVYSQKVLLIISIDDSDDRSVYDYANDFIWKHGEKIVIHMEGRQGLRKHVIRCGNYLNEYNLDALVIFEDDIIPSRDFFKFVTAATEMYIDEESVAGISLYTHFLNFQTRKKFIPLKDDYDSYFFQCAQSWGQVWFKNQWNEFMEWYYENENKPLDADDMPIQISEWPESSWLKYHIKYCIERDKYFVYPYISYTTCFSDVGEHTSVQNNDFQVPLSLGGNRPYLFPRYGSEGVYYDAFFENKSTFLFNNIKRENVLLDLYANHTSTKKMYVVTTRKLNYKCIKSWGMRLVPHELNIVYDINGSDIFMFDLENITGDRINLTETKTKLYLYGSGAEGRKWLNIIGNDKVSGFIDTNSDNYGKVIEGKYVYSLNDIKVLKESTNIYISTNATNRESIYKIIEKEGLEDSILSTPYDHIEVKKGAYHDADSVFEGNNILFENAVVENCKIGYATYIGRNSIIINASIGRFTSIGQRLNIVIGQHPTNTIVSTHPAFYSLNNIIGFSLTERQLFDEFRYTSNGNVVEIGNDVWIGNNVSIMEGVKIADGTIVAANSNVVKDTEPYSIVAGNPARIIKYRFSTEDIDYLMRIKWWEKPLEWIIDNGCYFDSIDHLKKIYPVINDENR